MTSTCTIPNTLRKLLSVRTQLMLRLAPGAAMALPVVLGLHRPCKLASGSNDPDGFEALLPNHVPVIIPHDTAQDIVTLTSSL
ncbi:hypothetical protein [Sporisorium scitamineum]|uniref:Uncharacterized protein n=1 Tax=Sporisorium scitamineum TaxID=49012 RepID=A0A0F7SDS4_9BASI|nr:hypothetical protein [Sporisorium scitamineum]